LKAIVGKLTYRGTEQVVCLQFGHPWIGIPPANGGSHRHYEVGIEQIAFQVETAPEDRYPFFAFDPDGIRIEVVCDRHHAKGWI
jgi:hypothetical protein